MPVDMCGILGFFETDPRRSRPEMQEAGKRMSDALAKRGPDDAGHWQDPDFSLLLGHRRLSIIDLSAQGHQPMESASGRYLIVYNGEIYNFQGLAAALRAGGAVFRGRSDTEVMLAAFDQWGINQALQKFSGMFAFVLWDRKEGRLHFIRDRLGEKPLYVGWAGKSLVFGSELKALRAHPDFQPRINRDSLTLYMRYACVPAPFCIYQDVWQIPAGCRMALDLKNLVAGADLSKKSEPYWHHPRVIEEAGRLKAPVDAKAAFSGFQDLLTKSVQQRMISDVPLGAFLSGGIDSSTVVCLMQKLSARPVETFTIGFEENGFDEAIPARKIAAYLGTNHHELYISHKEALGIIPRLPEIYDEPFADASQIPAVLLSHFARQHVTVALSGDGGDELCAGYQRHFIVPDFWRKARFIPAPLRMLAAKGIAALPPSYWSHLVPGQPQFGERIHKIAEILPLRSPEEIYRRLLSQFPDPAALVKGGAEPFIPLTDPAWQPQGLTFAEQMIYGDTLSYLPNDVLTKLDRASMAASLETRAPFLDHRLFEYVWSLPPDMRIHKDPKGVRSKWLLREILLQHLPSDLYERPKQGFSVPIGEWLRGALKDWAQEQLDEARLEREGYFDSSMVRALLEAHLKGKGRHEGKLWTVLMFQSWLERWG